MKCAIIVGHTPQRSGQFSYYLQRSEFDYNSEVASYLKDVADIYYRPTTGGYSRQIRKLAQEVNKKNYDFALELHFNGFDDEPNNIGVGTEAVIFPNNQVSRKWGGKYCQAVSEKYGTVNRGVKEHGSGMRGYEFLRLINANAIILEPFFGDEYEAQYFSNTQTYANLIRTLL